MPQIHLIPMQFSPFGDFKGMRQGKTRFTYNITTAGKVINEPLGSKSEAHGGS